MQRFVTLAILILFAVPVGISISGCSKSTPVNYCNGGSAGPVAGQVKAITLQPQLFGISLDQGEIGSTGGASATDCFGTAVGIGQFTYGSTDMTLADVQPNTGRICAGTWNRNTPGVPDFTTCTPNGRTGVAQITASAGGGVSNPINVYIHPKVASVVLGTPSANCSTDPTTTCCPYSTVTGATPYDGLSCISQGQSRQLVARIFDSNGNNISCQVGHLTYNAQTPSVFTVDENGLATAQLSGSTIITANIALASSSAGFFSTCPPASITLSVPGTSATQITVTPNNLQSLNAVVKDTNGVTVNGLPLEFISTTPIIVPNSNSGTVTPVFPGAATITAICQPSLCNPAPYDRIGLFGNGKPVSSNPIGITAPGTNGTILFAASTQSQYVVPIDFTTTATSAPTKLPYVPNSMVVTQDGTALYFGSSTEIFTFSTSNNTVIKEDNSISGFVLASAPDNGTIIVSDPVRKIIYIDNPQSGVVTTFGGIGTRAQYAPDSQTVYITGSDGNGTAQLFVFNSFTGWHFYSLGATTANDVAVTAPSVGAYIAGTGQTSARTYCPVTTTGVIGGQPTVTNNVFYPQSDSKPISNDRIATTNDGKHAIGAVAVAGVATLNDLITTLPTGACPPANAGPQQFVSVPTSTALPIAAASITGVVPANDSSIVFVTYTAATATATGVVLPGYIPNATGVGALSNVTLAAGATAPVAGVFAIDNKTFYVGTSGDNLIHLINPVTRTDASQVAPKLPGIVPGTTAVPNLLAQRPRKTT